MNVYGVKEKFRTKFVNYLRDGWNYLDALGCLVFAVGMSLRFAAFSVADEQMLTSSRFATVYLCTFFLSRLFGLYSVINFKD
jgi:hypothetical protein